MSRKGHYFVYHDESESMPDRRWLLIGLLFIRADDEPQVQNELRRCRQQENYWGEVHFADLPKSFRGEYGGKARLAQRWMKAYEESLHEIAFFTVLAVDRHSPKFERHRFSRDFHVYNRFTALALKSGIVWHLGLMRYDEVELTFVTDAKSRASSPENSMIDNFEAYLPYRAELDAWISWMSGKSYPNLRMNPIQARDSQKDDCLQLTDVLLGACQVALTARSKNPTKRNLGWIICRWCLDLKQETRRQSLGLHRKFSFQIFPDNRGGFADPPLALSPPEQPSLPGFALG